MDAKFEEAGKTTSKETVPKEATPKTPKVATAPTNTEQKPTPILAQPARTNAPAATKQKPSVAKNFSLKGLTKNANNSVAIVYTGMKTYTIVLGETLSMDTTNGKVSVNFQKVNDSSMVSNIGGERTMLSD